MQVLIHVLCFLAGFVSTLGGLAVWGWYLRMQDRLAQAESAKKEMEDTLKLIDEQQKDAALALQKSISELVKRRTQYQAQNTTPAAAPQVPQDASVAASVKERLRKAVELTAKQSKIDVRQGHEFVMQHNELELEKLAVLKSILADGFDPVITIRYNTGDQEMLLSNYVQSITKGLA